MWKVATVPEPAAPYAEYGFTTDGLCGFDRKRNIVTHVSATPWGQWKMEV
jgi:hypothetical protein